MPQFQVKMDELSSFEPIEVVITNGDGAKSFLTFRINKDEMDRPQGQIIAKMKDGQEKTRQISGQWTYWKNETPAVAPAASETPAVTPPLQQAA